MRKIVWMIPLFLFAAFNNADEGPDPDEIIRRFAAQEAEFKEVWQHYTYKQSMIFEVLDRFGSPREQKKIELEVFFDTKGRRKTRILSEEGQLRSVKLSDQDIEDAVQRQPFVLTTEELDQYKIKYRGEEWVDEINTYVFDIEPEKIKGNKRYFNGRIWVDDLDLQIVKTRGKIVPDYRNNKFPEFETIRQQVDGKYWFPVWIKADDHLTFGSFFNQQVVHVRAWITLKDFQKFEVSTSIQYEEEKDEEQ